MRPDYQEALAYLRYRASKVQGAYVTNVEVDNPWSHYFDSFQIMELLQEIEGKYGIYVWFKGDEKSLADVARSIANAEKLEETA